MTDAKSGMQGSLWVCTTLAGTYTKVAELSDLSLKIDGAEIDTSNVDDDGWGSSITGKKSWDISPKANFIVTDTTGYGLLMAALLAQSPMFLKILSSGTPTVSPVGWSGIARVMNANIVLAGTNTQQKIDWSLKGNGALTVIT